MMDEEVSKKTSEGNGLFSRDSREEVLLNVIAEEELKIDTSEVNSKAASLTTN